jgi:hypothetical protein
MKKHLLEQIGSKIEKNKVVKLINKKLDVLNHLFESKESVNINMKQHTISKKWSPFEKRILKMTR